MTVSALTRFKNRHSGQRCVVVCNGPSLNRMDLEFLRHEIVFGLNKIHLGLEKFGFYPRYLVAVNHKVIAQSAETFRRMTAIKFISELGADLLPQDAYTRMPIPIISRPKTCPSDFTATSPRACAPAIR